MVVSTTNTTDVVHCVQLSLTGTKCSYLMAYGTERDYVVLYALYYILLWCFAGLSCYNVAGGKSGEPGAYYVI